MTPCGRVEGCSIIYCCVGALLLVVSMFIPRWRLDEHGTGALQEFLVFRGFEHRSYGLLHVVGSFSQSWSTLRSTTCEFRDLSQVSAIGHTVASLFRDGSTGACDGSERCSGGFLRHMEMRCRMYERLWTFSSVTVALTFLSVTLVACGALTYTLSHRRRMSGVVFTLNLLAGILSFVLNTAWAFVSDASFKALLETGWFPYPSLAIGYWLHLYGAIMILVAGGVFGYLTIQAACDYDPTQDKIDKRNKKRQKINARMQEQALRNQQNPPWQMQQQQPPPPPPHMMPTSFQLAPGYGMPATSPPGGYGCPPGGYGSPMAQMAPPMGFNGGAMGPPPPVQFGPIPTTFGLPAVPKE